MLKYIQVLAALTVVLGVKRGRAAYADLPCNSLIDTRPTPDQSLCSSAGSQGVCTLDSKSGNYFCGWKGAACSNPSGTIYESAQDACDFGTCQNGKCSGSFGDTCTPNDELRGCLGWLLCSPSGVCGGKGSVCADFDGCISGLECVFSSVQAESGICLAVSLPPPGPSQRRHKRDDRAKYRLNTWD